MKIIVKTKNVEINRDIESYIIEKIKKFEKLVLEPAICEVRLEDEFGSRGGNDKTVHLYMTLPKMKNPIHLMERTSDWFGSIDLIEEKLKKELIKYKEKVKIGTRFPKKYHEAELEEEAAEEL